MDDTVLNKAIEAVKVIKAALAASEEKKRIYKDRYDNDPEFRHKVQENQRRMEYRNTVYGYDRPVTHSTTVQLILERAEKEREEEQWRSRR